MLVLYKRANYHTFMVRDISKDPQAGVDSLSLLPGVNEVDDALWAKVRASAPCLKMIDDGIVSEIAPALSDLKGKKLETAIAETMDDRVLDSFEDKDARPEVKTAIRKQREVISEKTTPESKTGGLK